MLFSTPTFLAAGLFASVASANSHISRMDHHKRVNQTATAELAPRGPGGEFSWFETGLGACGIFNNANDYIVAIPHTLWDSAPFRSFCGQQITITVNGRRATATVADRCPGCHPNKLDLTSGLFSYLANFGDIVAIGILQGDWEFGDGGDEERKKKEEEERRKKEEDDKRQREEEERKKQKEEEDRRKDEEAARSRSSASAAQTSTSSAAPTTTSTSASVSVEASTTSSGTAASATNAPANLDSVAGALNQAQVFLAQAGLLAVKAYQA